MICTAPGCPTEAWQAGLCQKHYTRLRRHGSLEPPLKQAPARNEDRLEYLLRLCERRGACLIYLGRTNSKGYGILQMLGETLAHRVSYVLQIGPVPKGLTLMHSCDTPACVEITHLTPGTKAENNADMKRKGRWHHVLTDEQVRELRAMRDGGALWREVAAHFGITIGGAHAIYHKRKLRA